MKVWSCVCNNLISSMYGLDWTHSDILSPHCSLYFNIQILILYSSASLILVLIPVSLRITNSFLLTSFRPENYVAQTARLPADIKYETLKVYQHDTRIFLSLILSLSLPYLKKYRNRKEDIRFKILQILCEPQV